MSYIKKHRYLFLTLLFLIFSFFMFGTHIFNINVWYDEAFQMVLNNYSFKEIINFVKNDTSPPLYALLLKIVTTIFNNNSLTIARLLSWVIFSIQFILAFYPMRKLFGIKTSLVYSSIILYSFFSFFASIEIRLYGMSMMSLTGATLYSLLYIKENKKKDLCLYILFGSIAMYSHNYTTFAMIFLTIITFIYSLIKKKGKFIISGNAIVLAIYSPWLMVLVKQAKNVSTSFWINKPTWLTLLDVLHKLFSYNNYILIGLLTLLIIAFITSKNKKDTTKKSIYVLLPAFLSLTLFITYSFLKAPLYIPKYTVPVCGLIYLAISVIIGNSKYKVIPILFILFLVPTAITCYKNETINNDDSATKAMLKDINNMDIKDKKFYITSEDELGLMSYYFPNSTYYIKENTRITVNNPEMYGNIRYEDKDTEYNDDYLFIVEVNSIEINDLKKLNNYIVLWRSYYKCSYNGGYYIYALKKIN